MPNDQSFTVSENYTFSEQIQEANFAHTESIRATDAAWRTFPERRPVEQYHFEETFALVTGTYAATPPCRAEYRSTITWAEYDEFYGDPDPDNLLKVG